MIVRFNILPQVILALSMLALPAKAADPVRIGAPNWASVEMTAQIIKAIVEQRLETEVVIVHADNDAIYNGMNNGTGPDVHPEAWLPNHQSYVERFGGGDGTIIVTESSYDAIQGICVNRVAFDEHGISAIHHLADPTLAAAFDSDGDGLGEIWIGAEGWLSTDIERVRAKSYGYAETLELIVSDEVDALANLDTAIEQNRPFAFFCYGPHHMFQLHDLVLLEEPVHDPHRWVMITPDQDPNWLNKASIDVAWPPTEVHMAYTAALAVNRPEITELLESMQLNSRLVSAWTYALEVDGVDPEMFARRWVKDREDLVNRWLGE
ncbi:MAG: glycine betaine ABC transporter substrate-binding protein [Rhodospirillales bacterium]